MIFAYCYRQLVLNDNLGSKTCALQLTAEQQSQLFYYRKMWREGFDNAIQHEKDPTHLSWGSLKSEIIKKIANGLAKCIDLKDPELEIKHKSQISTHIKHELKERYPDYDVSNIARDLDDVFKRSGGYETSFDVSDDETETKTLETLSKEDLEEVAKDPEEFRKLAKKAEAQVDRFNFVAKEKGIALVGHKEKPEKISTIKPEPGKTKFYYATHDLWQTSLELSQNMSEFAKVLEGCTKKAEEFPITNKRADAHAARRLRPFDEMLHNFSGMIADAKRFLMPNNDEKHAQSTWGWFDTLVKESWWGKHAAGKKTIIEAIGKHSGEVRYLTRERVGDINDLTDKEKEIFNRRVEPLWEFMKRFSKSMEDYAWWLSFYEHRDISSEYSARTADRRIEMHEKLSESAFSSDQV